MEGVLDIALGVAVGEQLLEGAAASHGLGKCFCKSAVEVGRDLLAGGRCEGAAEGFLATAALVTRWASGSGVTERELAASSFTGTPSGIVVEKNE